MMSAALFPFALQLISVASYVANRRVDFRGCIHDVSHDCMNMHFTCRAHLIRETAILFDFPNILRMKDTSGVHHGAHPERLCVKIIARDRSIVYRDRIV
jgi:hypothetical protein